MYTVTICFLVYSATSFLSSAKYLRQMGDIIFGADITLKALQPQKTVALDEFKLREIMNRAYLALNSAAKLRYKHHTIHIDVENDWKCDSCRYEFK